MCSFAKQYPEYSTQAPPSSPKKKTSLVSTLKVHAVHGTVAVTLAGVRRPITPFATSSLPHANYVQCVLHIENSTSTEYVEGRLFISPWLAFQGSFPMRGSYFVQNELFEVEGICRAPRSSLVHHNANNNANVNANHNIPTSVIHLARSIPVIFRPRPTSEVSRIFRSGYVCCRRFRFPRQLKSYGKHFTGRTTLTSSSSSSSSSPTNQNGLSAEAMATIDVK
jgi:hypothetical protein